MMIRNIKQCLSYPIWRNEGKQLLPNLLGKDLIIKAPLSEGSLLQRNLSQFVRPILRSDNFFLPSLMGKRTFKTPSGILYQAPSCGQREGKLPPKMKKLMKIYQTDDGLPVFLKGGPMDNILYRLTLVLTVIGLILNFVLYFGFILA